MQGGRKACFEIGIHSYSIHFLKSKECFSLTLLGLGLRHIFPLRVVAAGSDSPGPRRPSNFLQ